MNNIFLNNNSVPDPLLATRDYRYEYPDIPYQPQYNDYRPIRNVYNQPKDWVGELDNLTKNLSPEVINSLNQNNDYVRLSNNFQQALQNAIMSSVKDRLNNNPDIINNIQRQMEVINDVKNNVNLEQQQNLNELNDYMKNYSHLTFQEYKNIKNGVKVEIDTAVDNTVVATVNNNTVKSKKK